VSAWTTLAAYRDQILAELCGNILPFWIAHAVDEENGGFYGEVNEDMQVHNEVPRSAILCGRILWTYSAAYRTFGDAAYLTMARRAYAYLTGPFLDPEYGGIYWNVLREGRPANDRKHVYAQGFAIYGLSEYFRATGEAASLALARELFRLIEAHSHDTIYGGNIECCSRSWGPLADMRLSEKEPDCRKTMNTMLHLMEAYTTLLRVWDDAGLRSKQAGLIQAFIEHIVNPETGHFRLFFDDAWHALSERVSYGHDIEGSWLLVEAAEMCGDAALLAQVRSIALRMADAVLREGLGADGAIVYERNAAGAVDHNRHWWAQAEGLVGMYNAYQLSGRREFLHAASRLWEYISDHMIDREHGEWFRIVSRDGGPDHSQPKIGPWECPYHNSRACLEMLTRL
jgi:cellobiose epimerase